MELKGVGVKEDIEVMIVDPAWIGFANQSLERQRYHQDMFDSMYRALPLTRPELRQAREEVAAAHDQLARGYHDMQEALIRYGDAERRALEKLKAGDPYIAVGDPS